METVVESSLQKEDSKDKTDSSTATSSASASNSDSINYIVNVKKTISNKDSEYDDISLNYLMSQ